jgi:hypothetical protein
VTGLTEGHRYYETLLSLLGNRNTSTDTLTTPVHLLCMVTNSRKGSVGCIATNSRRANVFFRAVRVLYRVGNRGHQPVSLWDLSELVSLRCQSFSGIKRVQYSQ